MKDKEGNKSKRSTEENKGKKQVIWYICAYIAITVGGPFMPMLLSVLFKSIVGYSSTMKELMPDIILVIVGIFASSLWGTFMLIKRKRSDFRIFIAIIQIFVLLLGFSFYSFHFGVAQLYASVEIKAKTIKIILLISGIVLFLDTIWDITWEVKEYNKITKQGDSSNE